LIDGGAFYCTSSGMYFLGAVGLVNSLRLVGHTEPVFLLDCGLSDEERELLAPEVTVVPAPDGREPFQLKTVLPARHPAEVMVLIDADMIVTRPLLEPIATASADRVLAVEHPVDRFVPEWGELLGLGAARPRRYLSSGLVFLGGPTGREVVRLMEESGARIDFDRTMFRTAVRNYPFDAGTDGDASKPDDPFFFADQDLLNAVLASAVAPERVVEIEEQLAPIPPFEGLRVVDGTALRCSYTDGTEPYVIHHFANKPWLEQTHHGIYSRLLRRLLTGPDVAIRVPETKLPLRLRTGTLAYLERKRVNARERVRWHVSGPLSSRIRALRGRDR
jgi:hypothetical protein